jgi:hypothetical protein
MDAGWDGVKAHAPHTLTHTDLTPMHDHKWSSPVQPLPLPLVCMTCGTT